MRYTVFMSFEVEIDDDTIETVVNDPHDALGIPKDIEGAAVIVDDIVATWLTTDVIDPSNGVVWSPDDKEELECGGHPPGAYDQAGQTVYCDGSCEELDEWATEWAVYIAFECGNCHNIMRLIPEEAIDQVFDAEGWVLCGCGAPIAGETRRGTWTP